MMSTTHHALPELGGRLLTGALVLGILILTGIGVAQGHWPAIFSVDSPLP